MPFLFWNVLKVKVDFIVIIKMAFMMSLSDDKQPDIIDAFNPTS